jgi:hypothetical protein
VLLRELLVALRALLGHVLAAHLAVARFTPQRLRLAPRLQALAERLALFLGARNHREARPREAFREAVLDEAPDVTELLQVNLAVLVLVGDGKGLGDVVERE